MIKLSNKNQRKDSISRRRWLFKISIITLILTYLLGRVSDIFVRNFNNIGIALFSIVLIIFIGVIFDIIGIAVAAADDTPFLSMASKKVRGASHALVLLRNASQVSSFCNDVVGDICGILSGSAGTILVSRLIVSSNSLDGTIMSIMISSIIATLTVAGKAFGKDFAIENSQKIVLSAGYILSIFDKKRIGKDNKKTKRKSEK